MIDWAHYGSLNASLRGPPWTSEPLGEWHIQRKAGGKPKLGQPKLRMPGCSTDECDLNTTDLRTWPSQLGWPSDRAVFAWHDGTPTAVAPHTARAGVFSNVGRFEMNLSIPSLPPALPPARNGGSGGGGSRGQQQEEATIDGSDATAPPVPVAWKLTLYLGLFNWRGDLPFVKQATLTVSSQSAGVPMATISHNITHLDGNNNDIKNVAVSIIFTKDITVSYGLPQPDLFCNRAVGSGSATVWQHNLCSFVAWQAATLEEYIG